MDKALTFLAFLLIAGILAIGVPVGMAVAETWSAGTTAQIITASAAVCGASLAVAGLGLGLAVGLRGRERRREPDRTESGYTVMASQRPASGYDYWRSQKMEADAKRAGLRLEQEQRALLEAPEQEPGDVWPADGWQWIDATEDAHGDPGRHGGWPG